MLLPAAHLHVGASGPASFVFDGNSGSYLQATVGSSAPNLTTTTISFWLKPASLASAYYGIFSARVGGDDFYETVVNGDGDYLYSSNVSFSPDFLSESANSILAVDVWDHFVVRIDTTQASGANRVRMYKNASELSLTDDTIPSQNFEHYIFANGATMFLGKDGFTATARRFVGRIAFVDVVENASLDSSSFAFDNSGVWTRMPYGSSHGTHGFEIDGSDAFNTTAGKEYAFTTAGSVTLDFEDLPPYTI